MSNGDGYVHDKAPKLWVIDVADGSANRITSGPAADEQPAWSPDGKRIAFVSQRHPNRDLTWRYDVYVVDAEGAPVTRITGGRGERWFRTPSWSPDGRWLAVTGHRYPAGNGSRNDVWRFRVDREDSGESLTGDSDLMVGAGLGSDLFGFGEPRTFWSAD